jgi:hypothetical protein
MRILYFTSPLADYLSDSLLHGLKTLYGTDCVDYPKCEILYRNYPETLRRQVYGRGFTLYTGLLDDLDTDRYNVLDKLRAGFFDLVVISDIQRQFGWFTQVRPWLRPKNTLILDGADTPKPYPARGEWWRPPYYGLLPRAHRKFLYFKREWTPQTRFSLLGQVLPVELRRRLPAHPHLRPISFSIPAEKMVMELPAKTKDFPTHVIDSEVAARIAGAQTSYAFESEAAYYRDLQQSRFGITTKRAGWDCLRHYEIAANGAVPCFRDLDRKPATCAPHGLTIENAISYRDADDLFSQLNALTPDAYARLQSGAWAWANEHTTVAEARRVLQAWETFRANQKQPSP